MVDYESLKKIDEYVKKLTEENNNALQNAKLFPCNIIIEPQYKQNGIDVFSGFIGFHIKFNPKEPKFLNEADKSTWYQRIKKIAVEKFGLDAIVATNLDFLTINFEEPSERELYGLTENKKRILEKGFERIKKYTDFYCSAVKDYEKFMNED